VLALDHVLFAVDDLAQGARWLEEREGLTSVPGGSHPGWGTANRIVPLGDAYLELIAVEDEAAAAATPFGRWVAGAARAEPRPVGWAVRTDELAAVARRLGLDPVPGGRTRPDGSVLRWCLAGIEQAVADGALPFFIEWEPGTILPGEAPAAHPDGPARLARVVVEADEERLAAWLGPHALPLEVRPGNGGIVSAIVERMPSGAAA
jgi:hypothetical protein